MAKRMGEIKGKGRGVIAEIVSLAYVLHSLRVV